MFGLIGSVIIVFGVVIAVMAGLKDLDWYFIFIASLVMGIGYITYRAPQVYGMLNTNILITLLLKVTIIYAFIAAPMYFVTSYFFA